MNASQEEPNCVSDSGGKFHTVQPLRDLESNWTVDLAKQLEEYLLKICSGEITGEDDSHLSVNFAEAALLLQGSIQVYSRKVEYLYSLVLHALELISQKSQHDQPESSFVQPQDSSLNAQPEEESDPFWGLDDIPVEIKNSLDSTTCRDAPLNDFVKPPANLVVLEGDCFDATGDGGELESYLLATNDIYRDFILLDSCDAAVVDGFLNGDEKPGKWQNGDSKGSSLNSKSRKSFQSPAKCSGGTGHKLSVGKCHDAGPNQSPWVDHGFEHDGSNIGPFCPTYDGPEGNNNGFEINNGYSQHMDFDDDNYDDVTDDPWKPLNPYEPGNLKVKPFKKVNTCKRKGEVTSKWNCLIKEFPLARPHGVISSEFSEIWEAKGNSTERWKESRYEKLRQSLVLGANMNYDAFCNPNNENDGDHDFGLPDFDIPENACMNEEVPLQPEEHDDGGLHFDPNENYGHEDPNCQQSLEDLCQSHLDSLLASIAETEKQTEMAARVSTWKQRIEQNLEEQDSHPPFDIHEYGERILDKLSLKGNGEDAMSFADVVRGQEKHDVARAFSALLQLVNNGDVDLGKGNSNGESTCHTAVNPFYVRLLRHDKRREEVHLRSSKKRAKSPLYKRYNKCEKGKLGKENSPVLSSSPSGSTSATTSSQLSCKYSLKLRKASGVRCTPDGKRRRSSRFLEPLGLHSAG